MSYNIVLERIRKSDGMCQIMHKEYSKDWSFYLMMFDLIRTIEGVRCDSKFSDWNVILAEHIED